MIIKVNIVKSYRTLLNLKLTYIGNIKQDSNKFAYDY